MENRGFQLDKDPCTNYSANWSEMENRGFQLDKDPCTNYSESTLGGPPTPSSPTPSSRESRSTSDSRTNHSSSNNGTIHPSTDSRTSQGASFSKEELNEQKTKVAPSGAPNGGWGWMVVLGAFISHTLGSGVDRSKGILYLELLNRFDKSATETTWVLTLSSSIGFLCGPFVSGLCDRLSCRTAGYIGTLMTCVGLLVSGFAPNLTVLYITYGIITGIGKTLAYTACLILIGLYFDKRLGVALGLSTAGSGAGSFAFPPLMELLFASYGFLGSFMMLAAIFSNTLVAASLFRPLRDSRMEYDVSVVTDGQLPAMNQDVLQEKVSNAHEAEAKKCKLRCRKQCNLLSHYAFTATCLQVLFHHMAKQAVVMFLPAFAVSRGISVAEAAVLLSASGICEAVSKLLMTIILDIKQIKPYRLPIYSCVVVLMGIVAASLPSLTTFLQFLAASSLYGLLSGTRSQKTIVIIDTLGADHLTGAMGWLLLFQGVGSVVGPTVAAVYKDYNGNYDMTIYLGAIGHLTGGLFMITGTLWMNRNKKIWRIPKA